MADDDLEQTPTTEAPAAPEVESIEPQPLAALPGPSVMDMLPDVEHDEAPKPAANPFDRFDKMPAVGPRAPKTGNPFDAFDSPKDRAVQSGLDALPEFSLLKEAFRSRALVQSLDEAVSKDALASEARRSLAQIDPTGQKAWLDWEIGDAKSEEEKWQGELRQIREAGTDVAPAELPRIMDALEQAQQRLTLARTMRDDLDRGVERAHSMPYQMALARSVGEQEKRVAYQNDVLKQVLEDPTADPVAIANARANVQFEQGKLDKLRSHQEKGQQRVPVQGATGTGEFTRNLLTGAIATPAEMLGGAAVRYGQDMAALGATGTGDALEALGNVVRDFGQTERRNTPAEASPNLLDLDWQKKGFFNDLKLYMAAKLGQGLGTSATVIGAAAVGGTPAAMGLSVAMGQGQMQNALEEAFQEKGIELKPETARYYAYLHGTAIGALESVTELWALGGLSSEVAAKSLARSLASGVAKGAAIEGITEGLQEILEIHGVSRATGTPIDWTEARRRVIEATAAGAIPGAAMGTLHAKRPAAKGGTTEPERPELVPQAVPTPVASEPALQPVQPQVEAAPAPAAEAAKPAEPTPALDIGDTFDLPPGATLSEDDINSVVDMWQYVQEIKGQGEPVGLAEWLKAHGGLREDAGELRNMLGSYNKRPGLVSKSGMNLDDATLRAWEAGFLEGDSRPEINDLLNALDDDLRGYKRVATADRERMDEIATAQQMQRDLEDLGIRNARSEEDIRRILGRHKGGSFSDAGPNAARESASGPRGDQAATGSQGQQSQGLKAYLDEGGTLAKSDMPALAERLGVTEQELPKLLDEAVTAGTLRKTAGGMYRRAADQAPALRTPEAAQAAIDEAIASMKDILPKGTKVQTFGATAELPEGIRAPAQQAEAQGKAVDAVHSRRTGDIYLHQFAVDPAAKLGHEGVHALVTRGLMTAQEIKLLAERAAKIPDIFDRATYEQAYAGRENLPALLDEEAAAHLIEARIKGNDFGKQINGILDRIVQFFERLRNALAGKGFQTADDVANAFFSGEMAAREPAPPGFRETPWGDSPPPVSGFPVIRGEAMFAIRAYHGSPHEFDRFSLDKIGTGEGAQAYGHGLYFAENEGVARNYRDNVKTSGLTFNGDGVLSIPAAKFSGLPDVTRRALLHLKNESSVADARFNAQSFDKPIRDEIERLISSGEVKEPPPGHLYEVRINADPEHFLDWDKPLSQQSEKVREAVAAVGHQTKPLSIDDAALQELNARQEQALAAYRQLREDYFKDAWKDPKRSEGAFNNLPEVYRAQSAIHKAADDINAAMREREAQAGRGVLEALAQERTAGKNNAEAAINVSQRLRDAGIPGIKYLDQGSRTAGEGSRNFVVFDDKLIEIVKKNGEPVTAEERQDILSASTPQAKASDSGTMFAIRDAQTGQDMRRDLDALGFYSKALEAAKALKQAKGTPEQMLAQLKSAGVKEGEIAATGLDKFLSDPSVKGFPITKAEIVKHLEENRVGLTEAGYGAPLLTKDVLDKRAVERSGKTFDQLNPRDQTIIREDLMDDPPVDVRRPRWAEYSLDPSNPTYRETVLHLPSRYDSAKASFEAANPGASYDDVGVIGRAEFEKNMPYDFGSGHFSEPNIVGHTMTSMVRHQGKPTFLIDQIQSDWGQKIRDADPEKAARTRQALADFEQQNGTMQDIMDRRDAAARNVMRAFEEATKGGILPSSRRQADMLRRAGGGERGVAANQSQQYLVDADKIVQRLSAPGNAALMETAPNDLKTAVADYAKEHRLIGEHYRIKAEVDTAKDAPKTSHPLVNTTDQWTTTTLRRALTQAVEAGVGQIAIPSGDTVLSYNPGNEHGMAEFYNKIVPKNLRNILQKLDKETPTPTHIDTVDSPSGKTGLGKGFTLFQITDKVKQSVQSEGQAMFALRDRLGFSRPAPELQSMNALVRDLGADLGIVVRRGFKTTASKVAKAAATRAGELLPAYYDQTTGVLRLQKFNDITAFAEAAGKILSARYSKLLQKAVDKANQTIQTDLDDLARWRHQLPLLENNLQAMRTEASQIAAQGFMKDSAETAARGRMLERDIPIRERELEAAKRRVEALAARTQDAPVVPDDMSAYFTSYLSNPDGVRTNPFTDVFEATLDAADPALLGKIEGAQNAVAAYAKANPVEVMRSIIVPSTKQDAWDRFKSDAQRFGFRMALGLRLSDFYANVWANDHPFYLATRDMLRLYAEQTGTKLDLKALENPAKLWRSAAQARSRATRDLDKGIRFADAIDHSGPSFTDALTTALGPSYAEATDTGPGSRYRDFGAYLLARMGVERWERYEQAKASGELGQLREPYSTPKAVMRQAVVELETKFPTFAAAAEMLYKFQNNLLTLQWQKGLITDETYNALLAEKNYVPSLRWFEEGESLSGGSSKKGETALADIIKRFNGSQRDVIDPLASIALKVFKTRADIAVNDTLKRYLYLAEQVGPGGGLFAERLDPRQAQAITVSIKDALRTAAKEANLSENDRAALVDLASEMLGGNVTTTMFTQGILRGGKGEPVVYIREKGNVVPIRLGKMGEGGNASARLGQQIWEMLNTFGETHTNWVLQMMALPAQAVRGAVVSHPSFMLANIIRDAPAAFGYDPRAIPLWTQFKGIVDIARGAEYVERYRTTGGMMGGEATQLFDQFISDHDMETFVRKGYKFRTLPSFRDGVAFLQDAFSTRNWGDKAFGATVGAIAGFGIAGPAGMGVGAAIGGTVGGKALAAVGELSETATRAQLWKFAFERAQASGLSEVEAAAEAAFWAHDYGDYSRHGLKTDVFRRWVPFLNANLQANDSFFRRLLAKGDYGFEATKYVPGYVLLWPLYKSGALQLPAKLTPRQREELAMSAWAWFETMAVIGSASLVYALVYRDDDRIKMLPDSLRANHWNIPLDDLARAIGMDLPKEHRGKYFARIPKPFERAIVANTIERLAMEYAKNNPRWLEHWLSDAYEVTKPPLMPTMFDIPAQLLMNRDSFSGREIVPRQGAGQRMRSEQFDEYSSQFARWLGDKMNLSPMQVDFLISKLGSTWGRDATRANIPGAPWYDPKAPAQGLDEKFIASRFLYKIGKGTEAEKAMKEVMGGEDPIPKVFEAITKPYNRLDANAESYKFYKNRLHQDAKAFAKLDTMTPEERGYALLEGHWDGSNSKYQQLHPMKRAETISQLVSQMQKELLGDHATAGKKGPRQTIMDLSPTEKAAARDVFVQYKAMEIFNGLVLTGETGWKDRGYLPAENVLDELKTAAPEIHAEFTRRLEKAHVLPFEGVKSTWPRVKATLEGPELLRRVKDKDTVGLGALLAPEYSEAKFTR